MKIIIGVIGTNASGKDTVAEYIAKKINFPVYGISQPLKEIAVEKGIPLTRTNLIELGTELSREYGEGYLATLILQRAKDEAIITGMRELKQLEIFKANANRFVLISVDAKPELRFARSKIRHEISEGEDLEEFIKIEKQENSGYHTQRLFECMKLADFKLQNDGDLANLYQQVDNVLRQVGL